MEKALLVLPLIAAIGCSSMFYREIDGTSTSIGMAMPESSSLKVDVMQYLGGSKVSVKDPSVITHEYECSSTNTYFGIIQTREHRKSSITVKPLADQRLDGSE